jgi:CHAD domain-containing protein
MSHNKTIYNMKNIEIESTFPCCPHKSGKLEELHVLRTVKKLRYLLELLPEDKNIVENKTNSSKTSRYSWYTS